MRTMRGVMVLAGVVCATMSVVAVPSRASGGSGGSGGGSNKPVEVRVPGYVTAIDYQRSTITVGASYYGTGTLSVTSSTNISLDNNNCSFTDIKVGDWAEARYDYSTRVATKLTCTTILTP